MIEIKKRDTFRFYSFTIFQQLGYVSAPLSCSTCSIHCLTVASFFSADLLQDRLTKIILRRHYFALSLSYRDKVMQVLNESKKRSNDDDLRDCYSKSI